ncbi:hypothetical protein NLI96_g12122 [Meripilus lineatus]|uniref:RlpA-like protein double-psi beta-barrel domain-containing protein n=1 Tax=Meripilus lineatus TaxID=2056292 RepID=A0AAD5UQN8_9APHY|nr:hypothetical protein NLI96_g12122 [Physisporinus lineatus]
MVHFAAALIAGSALLLQNVAALAIGAPFEVEKRASLITHTGISYWGHAGLGACGFVNKDSDHIVGISSLVFGTGGNCNQWMEVTNVANGKTVLVQTRDSCEDCGRDDILLSPSAFAAIGDINLGVLNVQWHFKAKDFTPSPTIVTPTPVPTSDTVITTSRPVTSAVPITSLPPSSVPRPSGSVLPSVSILPPSAAPSSIIVSSVAPSAAPSVSA